MAFSLLPLAGSDRRRTIEREVVRGELWTHDQVQGLLHVVVPVRQVVAKLSTGGLLVHNPVAPTGELLRMMRELESVHGDVRHIVLGSVGLEHKALAAPCAREFPRATVWLAPGQWSFPLQLGPSLLGFPPGRVRTIPTAGSAAPPPEWASDFDYEMLGPLVFPRFGAFAEAALVHRRTRTLLVTDLVARIGDAPPEIVAEDPRALLFHARDSIADEIGPTADALARGWRRICLFAFYFVPAGIQIRLREALDDRRRLPPSMTDLGAGAVPFGLMPWAWVTDERRSFRALQGRGPLRVAPILQELILNRFPDETARWVERVCDLEFTRVIGSHMDNDVRARPADLRRAFGFLGNPRGSSPRNAPEEAVLSFLRDASDACTRLGITGPPRITARRPRWWRRRGGALAMSCTGGAGSPAAPLPPSAVPARPDGVYGVVMIGLFRLAFGAAVGYQPRRSWVDGAESYRALVEIASRLYSSCADDVERSAKVAAIFAPFPKTPQLLRDDRQSCETRSAHASALSVPRGAVHHRRVDTWRRRGTWRRHVALEGAHRALPLPRRLRVQGHVRRAVQAAIGGVLCFARPARLVRAELRRLLM